MRRWRRCWKSGGKRVKQRMNTFNEVAPAGLMKKEGNYSVPRLPRLSSPPQRRKKFDHFGRKSHFRPKYFSRSECALSRTPLWSLRERFVASAKSLSDGPTSFPNRNVFRFGEEESIPRIKRSRWRGRAAAGLIPTRRSATPLFSSPAKRVLNSYVK